MTDLSAVFSKPYPQQVAAFRIRLSNLQGSKNWKDVWEAQHDWAFMVAGAEKAELLVDFAAAMDRAQTKGTSLAKFRQDFDKAVKDHNWHGWTGESTEKGRAWRTRVIYRTNLATSHAAGRYAQLKEFGYEFWVYRHGNARDPRLQHLDWDGLILKADHPFWRTHYPPNGWGCTCRAEGARSMAGAQRLGGKTDVALPDDWDKRDPSSGSPPGIDKGWAYAPGASVADKITALAARPVNWDYSIAVAYMRDVPPAMRDQFSAAFRRSDALSDDLTKFFDRLQRSAEAGQPIPDKLPPQRTLGLATESQMDQFASTLGADRPEGLFDFALDQDAARHILDRHTDAKIERSRGQKPVAPADFGKLGSLLNDPDTVQAETPEHGRGRVLRITKRFGDERIVTLFEVRPGRKRFALISMWVEKIAGASPTFTP